MAYTDEALTGKIKEMYPDIEKHGIAVSLEFSKQMNAYVIRFRKGEHELKTHLEKKDADECMENIKCVYLGVQVGEFLKNFERA